MHPRNRFCLFALALTLSACGKPTIDQTHPALFASPTPVDIHEEWPRDLSQPGWHPSYPDAPRTPSPTPVATPDVEVEAAKPAIVLPPPPELTSTAMQFLLSTGGRHLIIDFEVGGQQYYDPHPERPPGASGITWGLGYDGGYYSASVIKSDWAALEDKPRSRLAAVSGLKGQKAQNVLSSVRDIFVAWAIAADVFDRVDVAREYSSAKRAMPGVEDLRPNAQAAIISVGFNRGWSMSGPNRTEMRAIRDLVPKRDYEGIAIQLRKMVRVWIGTKIEKGMTRRRIAEAKLVMTP